MQYYISSRNCYIQGRLETHIEGIQQLSSALNYMSATKWNWLVIMSIPQRELKCIFRNSYKIMYNELRGEEIKAGPSRLIIQPSSGDSLVISNKIRWQKHASLSRLLSIQSSVLKTTLLGAVFMGYLCRQLQRPRQYGFVIGTHWQHASKPSAQCCGKNTPR